MIKPCNMFLALLEIASILLVINFSPYCFKLLIIYM